MTGPLVIDASVFLNAFITSEQGHETSKTLLSQLQTRGVPMIAPTLLLPESAAAIRRGQRTTSIVLRPVHTYQIYSRTRSENEACVLHHGLTIPGVSSAMGDGSRRPAVFTPSTEAGGPAAPGGNTYPGSENEVGGRYGNGSE